MTRKTDNGSTPAVNAKTAAMLKSLRSKIDKLDIEILKLVNERASLATEIGKVKADNGAEVFSPTREDEVLKNVQEANEKLKGLLENETIKAIFREIVSGA